MSSVGSIITNVGALSALNSLSQVSVSMSTTEDELSTGMSINSPADNPAGYIEAQGFTSEIGGMDQAASNTNEAISLLQTAQGGITQQTNIAQKLYSLAVEAANGTETSNERSSLQSVATQLIGEMNNISSQTKFNGQSLLNGSFSNVQFQTGANEGDTQSLSITSTSTTNLGLNNGKWTSSLIPGGRDDQNGNVGYHLTYGPGLGSDGTNRTFGSAMMKIRGGNGSASVMVYDNHSAHAQALAINTVSSKTGVTAKGTTKFQIKLGSSGKSAYTTTVGVYDYGYPGATPTHNLALNNVTGSQLVAQINSGLASQHVHASMNSSGLVTITQASGANIDIYQENWLGQTETGNIFTASGQALSAIGSYYDRDVIFSGDVTLSSDSQFSLSAGSLINVKNTAKSSALSNINLSTSSGAEKAIGVIQASINQLGQIGAQIGAFQDGLQTLDNNDQQTTANATTALGVVQDANIPQVTNNLSEEQIQAQSGVAALKESTQLQQSYTSLLP